MKCIPTVIKYIETNKNKDIKNKTETIGFLVIITDNPENKKKISTVLTIVKYN
jgi:hypothetical protein